MTGRPRSRNELAAAATQRYARGTAIGAVVVTGTWHVANNLFCTVTGWSDYRWPLPVVVAWLVVAVFTVLGAVNMLSPRGRPRLALPLIGLPALLACVEVVIVATRGPEVILNANWGLDSFGLFAMLLLWRFRLRWLFVALAVNWVVSFAVILATGPIDRIELSRYVVVMYTSAAAQVVVAGGARLLQRNAHRTGRVAAEQAELAAARAAADAVLADRQRRYRELGQAVRDLLAGLASGELSPDDPAVQRRCAVEASRLRRLIAEHDDVPSPLVHELRACADVAERRDVSVALEIAGTLPPLPRQVRRALTEAPMHVLAGARSHARVTVFSGTDPREVEVSVVADAEDGPAQRPGAEKSAQRPGAEESAQRPGAENPAQRPGAASPGDVDVAWSEEGGTQWIRVRWTDR